MDILKAACFVKSGNIYVKVLPGALPANSGLRNGLNLDSGLCPGCVAWVNIAKSDPCIWLRALLGSDL